MGAFNASWLTTAIGILGAVIKLLTAYSHSGVITPGDIADAMTYILMGGAAKSFNVSGTGK
jgi:hypothetical protein